MPLPRSTAPIGDKCGSSPRGFNLVKVMGSFSQETVPIVSHNFTHNSGVGHKVCLWVEPQGLSGTN